MESKSAFSGGTKVTFNTDGVYSSGPQNKKPNSNKYAEQIKNSSIGKKINGLPNNKKIFLYGFLGAVVGCLLVLLIFSLFGGLGKNVTIGSVNGNAISQSDEPETLAEAVANKCLPSVVSINVYKNNRGSMTKTSLGSGVVLSSDGYIVTNQHVIESADQIKVNLGDQEYEADKIGEDESSDIAVIKLKNATNLNAIELGDSDNVKVGAWVMTIGCPFGLEESVATGIISATSRSEVVASQSGGSSRVYPSLIQTDAAINPGNSGGALVDKNGRLLGINALIESSSGNYSGVGFAIPVNYAVNITRQIIDGKNPTHAQLGIEMTDVNETEAQRWGWSVKEGAYIKSLVAGGPAEKAGLKVSDIITKIEGEKTPNSNAVKLEVRKHNPGDTITIEFNRAGETLTATATLGSDEATQQQQLQQQQQQQQKNNKRYKGQDDSDLEDIWKYFFGL